jgi:CubicO group peptidase (beta-lactamase class C family)
VLGDDEIRRILVTRIDEQQQATGIAIGVVDHTGRRAIAHGNAAKGDPRPIDADTIFEIGSISKVFTALLLADMVRRREVSLDDPASAYLGDGVRLPTRDGRVITLLDLATHHSGLPNLPANLIPRDPQNPYAAYGVEDLYEFLNGYTLPRPPGAEYEYSNLGAGLLGHVLACRAGVDYETLVRGRIAEPLGMADTGITVSTSMTGRMATGHNAALEPVSNWDMPTLAGAGALRSSVNDLMTFLEACLGYRDSPLAPAMTAMLDVRRPVGNTPSAIGLGWHRLGPVAWHNGGTGGFRSFIAFDPHTRSGVTVLANAFTLAGVDDIGGHIGNPNVPLANPSPRTASRPTTDGPAISLSPEVLDRHTGRYQLAPARTLVVTRAGDRLLVQALADSIAGPMFELWAESETRFFVKETGSHITFDRDADARTTALRMHRRGRDPVIVNRVP